MRGSIWKRTLAAAMALLIVTGGLPDVPFEELLDDVMITAEAAQSYTITWKSDDGTVLKTTEVNEGATPRYGVEFYNSTPTKNHDDAYSYDFECWVPEVTPATNDATYTAKFKAKEINYEVYWYNYDGTLLDSTMGTYYGEHKYTKETPTRPGYIFTGWSPAEKFTQVYYGMNNIPMYAIDCLRHTAQFRACRDFNVTWKNSDGRGHTIYVDLTSDNLVDPQQYVAPFRYVSNDGKVGASIKNVKIDGNISSGVKYAGGLVGVCWGKLDIENCEVSAAISSDVTGDGTHGGFVGLQGNGTLNIKGCVFKGSIKGGNTEKCAGFVGWRSETVELHDCLFIPEEITVKSTGSAAFTRNNADTYNCYYTEQFDDGTNYVSTKSESSEKWSNGRQARIISAGKYVNIGSGEVSQDKNYDVSGIKAYDAGLYYNGKIYAAADEKVALDLSNTVPAGLAFEGYELGDVSFTGGVLTVPDSDVTVKAVVSETGATYFDSETGELVLGGELVNNGGIVLPDGVVKSDVTKIRICSKGAVLPADCSDMFNSFTALKEADFTGADTSSCTDMAYMFAHCSSLESLDLSSFDTHNAMNMSEMFSDCSELEAVYVSDTWSTENVSNSRKMFENCNKLKGGAGTGYNAENIDADYAHIDKHGDPGYLTAASRSITVVNDGNGSYRQQGHNNLR